jgi:ABC-type transporter Mla subunit MlaD
MVFRACRGPVVLAAILLVPIGLAACGESSEEKATAQVCSSTKAIQAELSKLSGLSISTKAPEEIKEAAAAMGKEAAKIKESTANLPAASKAPVQTAQTALQAELAGLAKTLASTARSSGNIEAVLKQSEPQVKTAVAGLAAGYKQAYESLKCS